MKICTKCYISKSEIEFYRRKSSKDGLQSACKICSDLCGLKTRRLDPVLRQAHNAQNRARNKIRYDVDHEYRIKCNTTIAARITARKLVDYVYLQTCRARSNRINRNRYACDIIYRIRRNHYTMLRKRNLEGQFNSLSSIEQLEILDFYIKCPKGYHVDHIYPLSRGGLHCLSNLRHLSAHDNWIKSTKIPPNTDIDGTLICWS